MLLRKWRGGGSSDSDGNLDRSRCRIPRGVHSNITVILLSRESCMSPRRVMERGTGDTHVGHKGRDGRTDGLFSKSSFSVLGDVTRQQPAALAALLARDAPPPGSRNHGIPPRFDAG